MGQIQNKTYTAPDGSVYRVEDDGSITKIKGGEIQANEPPSKYQITPEGKIYRVESDGSVTYLGNAEERYSTENKEQSTPNLHVVAIKTAEEDAQEKQALRRELRRGKEIDFYECHELLNDILNEGDYELWKLIVKNHLSQPNIPPFNWGDASERALDFQDMICFIVTICVSTDSNYNPWGNLPYKYLSRVINSSSNINALECIDCLIEDEIEYTEYDIQLFNNIKSLAKNRWMYLITNAATANQETNKKKTEGGCLGSILLFLVSVITISLIFIKISAIS